MLLSGTDSYIFCNISQIWVSHDAWDSNGQWQIFFKDGSVGRGISLSRGFSFINTCFHISWQVSLLCVRYSASEWCPVIWFEMHINNVKCSSANTESHVTMLFHTHETVAHNHIKALIFKWQSRWQAQKRQILKIKYYKELIFFKLRYSCNSHLIT